MFSHELSEWKTFALYSLWDGDNNNENSEDNKIIMWEN